MSARIIVEKLIRCDYALFEKWNSSISRNQKMKCHQIGDVKFMLNSLNSNIVKFVLPRC